MLVFDQSCGPVLDTERVLLMDLLPLKVKFPHTGALNTQSIVQKVNGENITFDETVLKQVLLDGQKSRRIGRIGVVFDVYIGESIKTAERVNRGSKDVIVFSQIKGGHWIKNWKRMLTSTKTKEVSS